MATPAIFVGSNPIFGCASIHKFEHFWSVAVPLSTGNLKFESPIVNTNKNTFNIQWKFTLTIDGSRYNFAANLLLSIDNREVDVFINCYLVNISNNDYKMCIIKNKCFKYQSSVNCWETRIENSDIYDASYNANLMRVLRSNSEGINAFKDIQLKFQVEFKVMEMKTRVKPALELSKNLGAFRTEDKFLSDVTFIVSEREFQAHKSILIARSPVFAAMLSIDMQEKRNNKIYVEDVEPEVFEQFLSFVYSGEMDCEANDCDAWAELLIVAEKYGLEDLKAICMDKTTSRFSVEEMTKIFAIANFMNDVILKRAAVDFLARQEESVKESEVYKKLVEAHPFLLNEMKYSK